MVTSPTRGEDERAVEVGLLRSSTDRRNFLKWSGTAAATMLLIACDQSPTEPSTAPVSSDATAQTATAGQVAINLNNDLGILNFAYALEQLEAASLLSGRRPLLFRSDQRGAGYPVRHQEHEVVHREFFRAALGSAAIPNLAVDFSAVDFGSRDSVLVAAKVFEDTGVGAYNGAAQFLSDGDYLLAAGKIVSVEARHASAIRDVLGRSFAPQAFTP